MTDTRLVTAPGDYDRWNSLPQMFFEQARRTPGVPFLWHKLGGAWVPTRYGQAADQIRRLARGLAAFGLKPGERVVLLAESRPEWAIADLAIMAAGGITVPAYTTNTVADHHHILTHSGAAAVIVSTKALASRLLPAAITAPELRWIVAIEDLGLAQRPAKSVFAWSQVMTTGDAAPDLVDERVASLKRSDTACFIYTSGTGGTPKGVMLSHGAIVANCRGAFGVLSELNLTHEVFLSFLPLSHAYEHTAGLYFPISIGAEIYYAESVEKLVENIAEVRPTIMTAVPRLYEVMYRRIVTGLARASASKRRWFERTLALGRRKALGLAPLSFLERLLDRACELLVRRKVRQRFGGRLKAFVSGGAALNPEIGAFFLALGLRILQGYGQTEAGPVISVNRLGRVRIDTVGPAIDGVEIRLAEDGEILVRGEVVMQGYWRDEEATAKTVIDGWLHTGDIGTLDKDGYLKITDRKKDLIKLSGGDNISPARIEGFLVAQPEIAQAMVWGDRRPHLVGLLVPDNDFLAQWAERHQKPNELAQLRDNPELVRTLAEVVDRVNAHLSAVERVRRIALAPEGFTIENGMLTPSLKIRRHKIRERFGTLIDALYER
ncbi:MAG TPA: long-chain fatty acid--CoA ligase [Hypericibacter adhaerens]|uniref:AMP-dependent synthetase n=1 Tax=Hypericibacter adhaerens TaxID=2602016 RepID=A0A5J6N2U6_9PROT|nr:long-chain fatty acid--CoA ligase [Hypericibacter adhaerens]QEX24061.1 AMP-dependent synthetase [Hypericibacter adhaerens]HWA45275.1 long-chain fatty acid--CoA ligase [Hypericibacter adhaerens]